MRHVRTHRHHPRGMTLLIALAVISVVTAATLVSLRIVSQESEMQGRERHSREAFFAAEAGLAEGREMLTGMLTAAMQSNPGQLEDTKREGLTVTKLMQRLPDVSDDDDFPKNGLGWYEAIPSTPYTLQAGVGLAVDPQVNMGLWEMRDRNKNAFLSFPEQRNVTYRVVMHDDDDPYNRGVWVISLGEVQGADGVVLARSVVRALVFAESTSADIRDYPNAPSGGRVNGGPSSAGMGQVSTF